MPIFEYHCPSCGKPFEILIRSAKDVAVCPRCGEKKVKKLPSSFGFRSGDPDASSARRGCSTCGSSSCSTCGH